MSYRIEIHCHTAESSPCATVSAAEGMALYAQNGYDGVSVSDHFSRSVCGAPEGRDWAEVVERFLRGYRGAKRQEKRLGLDIFLGMELRFPGNEDDFLLFGLTEGFLLEHPWLYELDLARFAPLAHAAGLLIVQAHPFRPVCGRADPALLDGVEVHNGNPRHDSHNDLAEAWGREHGLFPTAGSDFHEPGDPQTCGLLLPDRPADEGALARQLTARQYGLLLPQGGDLRGGDDLCAPARRRR